MAHRREDHDLQAQRLAEGFARAGRPIPLSRRPTVVLTDAEMRAHLARHHQPVPWCYVPVRRRGERALDLVLIALVWVFALALLGLICYMIVDWVVL